MFTCMYIVFLGGMHHHSHQRDRVAFYALFQGEERRRRGAAPGAARLSGTLRCRGRGRGGGRLGLHLASPAAASHQGSGEGLGLAGEARHGFKEEDKDDERQCVFICFHHIA